MVAQARAVDLPEDFRFLKKKIERGGGRGVREMKGVTEKED